MYSVTYSQRHTQFLFYLFDLEQLKGMKFIFDDIRSKYSQFNFKNKIPMFLYPTPMEYLYKWNIC